MKNRFEPTEQEVMDRATKIAVQLYHEKGLSKDPLATEEEVKLKGGVLMVLEILKRISRLELIVERLQEFWKE